MGTNIKELLNDKRVIGLMIYALVLGLVVGYIIGGTITAAEDVKAIEDWLECLDINCIADNGCMDEVCAVNYINKYEGGLTIDTGGAG